MLFETLQIRPMVPSLTTQRDDSYIREERTKVSQGEHTKLLNSFTLVQPRFGYTENLA